MSDDYDDLLNKTWEGIPKPQVLPIGDWLVVGKNAAFIRSKKEGQSNKVLFTTKARQALDNVDEGELEELMASGYDITINDLNHTIYIESDADWNKVRDFLAVFGVELEGRLFDDKGKLAFNKAFRGAEAITFLEQRNWEDDAHTVHWDNKMTNFRPVED